MLHSAREQSEKYGDGHFEEVFANPDEGTGYLQLPAHPLDDDFDLMRHKLLAPAGYIKRGPFYN